MIEDRGRSHTLDMLLSTHARPVSYIQPITQTSYLDNGLVGILRRSPRRLGSRVQRREYPWIVPVKIKLPIFVLALFLDRRLLRIPIPLQRQGVIQV